MTLREKQELFVTAIAELIHFAFNQGYTLTFGEAWRSPEEALRLSKINKGIKRSVHCDRLAVDFNLFKDGKYMDKSEDFLELGMFWESLHPECAWGGHFKDGNHFSMMHEGRR